jgi:hypothetical protein
MSTGRNVRGLLTLALIGAALATVGDANHTRTGTLTYRHPWLVEQAWWVAPLFFVAFAVLAATYRAAAGRGADSWARRSAAPGSFGPFAFSATMFLLVYLASGFGHRHPGWLCVAFGLLFLVRWLISYERAFLAAVAIGLATVGPLFEGTLGRLDLVHYAHVDVYSVPLWLAGLYLHGAFALRDGMRWLAPAPIERATNARRGARGQRAANVPAHGSARGLRVQRSGPG